MNAVNPTEYANELRERCVLCGKPPTDVVEDFDTDTCHVTCTVCGRYSLTLEAFQAFWNGSVSSETKPLLSAVVRRHYEYTGDIQAITARNCTELASTAPGKTDVADKVRYLLDYIAHKSSSPGKQIILKPQIDYPVCFAANTEEFRFCIQHARELGFIEVQSTTHDCDCWLTSRGWEEATQRGFGEKMPAVAQPPSVLARTSDQSGDGRISRSPGDADASQFDVFFAYNAEDKPSITAIADVLRCRGIRVWLDAEQIRPGQHFQDVIQEALKSVASVAVFVGPTGLGRWQAEEIRAAISLSVGKGIPIIPVLLPGVDAVPEHVSFLAEFNWVRFAAGLSDDAAIERLLWGITGERSASFGNRSFDNGGIPVTTAKQVLSDTTRKPTRTNPGEGIPGRSGRVLFGLHGIRTHAGWARRLYEVGANAAWQVRMDRWNFGYFSLFQFLLPWARTAKVQWFRRIYSEEMENKRVLLAEGTLPSIVAHSFGTYILGNALLKYDWLRFDKVILCGSILPQEFPWDTLIERGQVQAVRNEYGVKDIWTSLVRWFVAGTGPSGHNGFTCSHPRMQQEQFTYDHSEYFDEGHMTAKWFPFLSHGLSFIPPSAISVGAIKAIRPWGLYALYACALASVMLIILAMLLPAIGRDHQKSAAVADEGSGSSTSVLLPESQLRFDEIEVLSYPVSKKCVEYRTEAAHGAASSIHTVAPGHDLATLRVSVFNGGVDAVTIGRAELLIDGYSEVSYNSEKGVTPNRDQRNEVMVILDHALRVGDRIPVPILVSIEPQTRKEFCVWFKSDRSSFAAPCAVLKIIGRIRLQCSDGVCTSKLLVMEIHPCSLSEHVSIEHVPSAQ